MEAKADIEAMDNNNNTALHYAAGYGQEASTQLLLKQYAIPVFCGHASLSSQRTLLHAQMSAVDVTVSSMLADAKAHNFAGLHACPQLRLHVVCTVGQSRMSRTWTTALQGQSLRSTAMTSF